MKKDEKKKKLLIEAIVIIAVILVFAVVVIVDTVRSSPSVELTVEQAQTLLDNTFEMVPNSVALTANHVVEESEITVKSVKNGNGKEIIFECTYETVDIQSVYSENKDNLFSSAYDFYRAEKDAGRMVNATKIRQNFDNGFIEVASKGEKVSGEIDIYVYELEEAAAEEDALAMPFEDTILRVYLSDEVINTVFGGLLNVCNDAINTEEFSYNGETLSIMNLTTLKRGISDCFSIRNFSIDKPDSSAYFVSIWNSFCDEFYRNFIKNAQWSYLAKGLLTTIEITLLAALFGILIGFICAIVRCTYEKTGKLMILDQIVRLYLTVIRGTPLMIQLMIIYFVLLLPVGIEKFPAAVLCFSINSGAYVAEIVRGGIMSVDGGQIEAGRSLGLNYIQTMYHIVVPQAFKAVLPSLANEFITLLKESSVAFYIGVADLTQGGLKIRSITYSNFMPLIAVAVIYLVMVLILTRLVGVLERRLRKDER